MSRIVDIQLDDSGLPPPTPEIEQERKVAMFDLLEENAFSLPEREGREVPSGPFKLALSIRDRRLRTQRQPGILGRVIRFADVRRPVEDALLDRRGTRLLADRVVEPLVDPRDARAEVRADRPEVLLQRVDVVAERGRPREPGAGGAELDPEIAAKSPQAPSDAIDSPPRIQPRQA